MENFILWSVSCDGLINKVSFFATPVHVQHIDRGTRNMVVEMLTDLEVPLDGLRQWEVDRRFVTNYLVDDDNDDWQDVWTPTWEILVGFDRPISVGIGETDLVRTWARDENWNGHLPSFPSECVLVADFSEPKVMMSALNYLDLFVNSINSDSYPVEELHAEFSEVPLSLLTKLRKEYLRLGSSENNERPFLTYRRRTGLRQIVVSLGIFDSAFFRSGSQFASLVSNLIHILGGTTTWNESTSPTS